MSLNRKLLTRSGMIKVSYLKWKRWISASLENRRSPASYELGRQYLGVY